MSECRPDPDGPQVEAKKPPPDQETSAEAVGEDDWENKAEWNLNDWQGIYDGHSSMDGHLEPTPMATKHVAELLPKQPGSVFLPLCGKSYDLKWFYDRGNTVYGVEGIENPVKDFFEYHKLPHSVESTSWGGKLYKTSDGRLQVHVCDIFALPRDAIGPVDAVLDCGAYVAINEAEREQYWAMVELCLKKEHRVLLEVCHDGPPGYVGSPHSIDLSEIKKTFDPKFDLKILSTEDISKDMGFELSQSFVLLTPKTG